MMHPLKRILFTILSCLSLLLFLAVAGVWIWSFFYRDIVSYVSASGHGQIIQSIRGRLHIISNLDGNSSGTLSHDQDRLVLDAIWNGGMSGYPVQVQWHVGHVWQTYSQFHMTFAASAPGAPPGFTTNHRLIVIPYWSPALLFSILPALWTWRFIKSSHRRNLGHCPRCNYDLRATPNRCPECGWPHDRSGVTA